MPTKRNRKLTPKQRVLRKWPDAYSYTGPGGIVVIFPYYSHGYSNAIASSNKGARAAWANAARRLKWPTT